MVYDVGNSMSRMPALFIGHGNPMNTLETNDYTKAWRSLGQMLPRPRAVLVISAQPPATSDIETLIAANHVVLALQPRPTPAGTESIKSPYLGPFNLLGMRAFLVGRTLLGLRVDDAIRAVEALTASSDVSRRAITGYGVGPSGMTLLHAGVLDTRLSKLVLEDTLASYRLVVEQPVHRLVPEVLAPGLLTRYDTPALLNAIAPRPLFVVSPRDAMGDAMSEAAYRSAIKSAAATVRVESNGVRAVLTPSVIE